MHGRVCMVRCAQSGVHDQVCTVGCTRSGVHSQVCMVGCARSSVRGGLCVVGCAWLGVHSWMCMVGCAQLGVRGGVCVVGCAWSGVHSRACVVGCAWLGVHSRVCTVGCAWWAVRGGMCTSDVRTRVCAPAEVRGRRAQVWARLHTCVRAPSPVRVRSLLGVRATGWTRAWGCVCLRVQRPRVFRGHTCSWGVAAACACVYVPVFLVNPAHPQAGSTHAPAN